MSTVSKSYYFEPVKIIRDLIHGYINLSRFELQLIDTIQFQRLKDIRQLTCQQVYPSARHTRFEHSLGVLELTKKAIKHLNKNGVLEKKQNYEDLIIDYNLQFNAFLAALLHDVGHCPFSHLGEVEIEKRDIKQELCDCLTENSSIGNFTSLIEILSKDNVSGIGSVHEQLSCIVIIKKFSPLLTKLDEKPINSEDSIELEVDFELIIRSILGIPFDVSNQESFENNKIKNVIVRLINSNIFDMDKLDYIMRDSVFTGIGTPKIDTQRLFRNMFFSHDYSLVFTSKAVPALQNMIDSRDELYMYVYNHHAVVFSDFMNSYILRKLSHNATEFINLVLSNAPEEIKNAELDELSISRLGLVPKSYLFNSKSVVEQNRSDSDWISMLIIIYSGRLSDDFISKELDGEIYYFVSDMADKSLVSDFKSDEYKCAKASLIKKISSTYILIERYLSRVFLKPWWKTIFEFSNFMTQNFGDDIIRKKIGTFICNGEKYKIDSSEFRSQIAKHVIFISQKLKERNIGNLHEALKEGDFFIVQRSNRFLDLEAIEKLDIALKTSEIIGTPIDIKFQTSKYYIKFLTNIIPQKDYSAIYAREGFYVFSKPIFTDPLNKKRHYEEIERIFVFVVTEFVKKGEHWFNDFFKEKDPQKEESSKEITFNSYLEEYYKEHLK